jgi:nicotinamidase-related amidase
MNLNEKSALLIIDMQEDFARPSGSAYINGTADIVSPLADMAAMFRKQKKNIFHVIRLYHPDGSNAERCRKEQIAAGQRIVSPGSEGAAILQELLPQDAKAVHHQELLNGTIAQVADHDYVLYKPRWGAFFQTQLQEALQTKGIDTLLVAGCNFPNCPRTTIYEASERDYHIAIVPSTLSGIYEKAITELTHIGVHVLADPLQFSER